jgi:hypothetical protein
VCGVPSSVLRRKNGRRCFPVNTPLLTLYTFRAILQVLGQKNMRFSPQNIGLTILASFCVLAPLAFKATPRGGWWLQGQGTLPAAQIGNAGVDG